MAAERLAEDGLQEEVGLLRVVDHDHEERHDHNQTGGNQRLPLSEGEKESALTNWNGLELKLNLQIYFKKTKKKTKTF